ncbi:hypothetical protein C8J57DRAFT_1458628 [Mycena rebaudengoi]|nr:hypothetical protein C8J57DRAFT_1458628 [Mycena rebaudengoi]
MEREQNEAEQMTSWCNKCSKWSFLVFARFWLISTDRVSTGIYKAQWKHVPSRAAVEHPAPSPHALLTPVFRPLCHLSAIRISARHASKSRQRLVYSIPPLQTPPPREPDSASLPDVGSALDNMHNPLKSELGSPNDGGGAVGDRAGGEEVREEVREKVEEEATARSSRRGSAKTRRDDELRLHTGYEPQCPPFPMLVFRVIDGRVVSYCGIDGWMDGQFVLRDGWMGGSLSRAGGVSLVLRMGGCDVLPRLPNSFSVEIVPVLYFTIRYRRSLLARTVACLAPIRLMRAHAQGTTGALVASAGALFDWDPYIGSLPPCVRPPSLALALHPPLAHLRPTLHVFLAHPPSVFAPWMSLLAHLAVLLVIHDVRAVAFICPREWGNGCRDRGWGVSWTCGRGMSAICCARALRGGWIMIMRRRGRWRVCRRGSRKARLAVRVVWVRVRHGASADAILVEGARSLPDPRRLPESWGKATMLWASLHVWGSSIRLLCISVTRRCIVDGRVPCHRKLRAPESFVGKTTMRAECFFHVSVGAVQLVGASGWYGPVRVLLAASRRGAHIICTKEERSVSGRRADEYVLGRLVGQDISERFHYGRTALQQWRTAIY